MGLRGRLVGMKPFFLVFAVVLAGLPLAAPAQQPPPEPAVGGQVEVGPMSQQQRSAMRNFMEQARKLHQQYRSQMLAALTPEHRQLLATLAGQLATSDNPDPRAAAQKLDAALSPAEKQGVVNAANTLRTQMQKLHQQMMAQFPPRTLERRADPGMLLLSPDHTAMGMRVMSFGAGMEPLPR
jgi:hypothetical protein